MKRMKNIRLGTLVACMCVLWGCEKPNVNIVMPQEASNRVLFAGEHLKKALEDAGYSSVMLSDTAGMDKDEVCIRLEQAADTAGLKKEGFTISTRGNMTTVTGNDGSGVIYGCRELIDHVGQYKDLKFPAQLTDAPEMVLRGGCVGIQKMEYLPGRGVYEYPYTPESFPWFYDKEQWIKYLDMLVENRMNSLYLWNGHPFASLVKLEEYPFAVEVDEETFKKNEEMFSFLTAEADKRGIFVIQMFYNILLSKPFAEHYGLKTQDRNRPITPLISDYTREAQKPFAATLASVIVYSLVSIFMYMIGMGAAIFTGEYDIAQIMLKTGFGVVGLLIIVFSTVTTTFLDAYSAGVSSVSISSKIKEKWAAIVVTVIGTVAAIVYPMDNITNFLYLIGSVFAPMIAVQIADYFILKKADAEESAFQWRNLVVWLVGFVLYRVLMHVDTPVGNTLPDMVITVIVCVIVEKIAAAVKEKREI